MYKIRPILPAALSALPLVQEARDEGFLFLDRMLQKIKAGEEPFATPPEAFLGAYEEEELIAVGGISLDPYGAPETTGRLRHLYVRPDWRRGGVGRALVTALLEHARGHFRKIRLRTDTAIAATFYETIGFHPSDEPDATHMLDLEA